MKQETMTQEEKQINNMTDALQRDNVSAPKTTEQVRGIIYKGIHDAQGELAFSSFTYRFNWVNGTDPI